MNVVIIEDELLLADQLKRLLKEVRPQWNIIHHFKTVKESRSFLKDPGPTHLILLDIYLNDGISFEIFKGLDVQIPVIFCTAYDEYALKAFELNSIDYLLKPVKRKDFELAVDKYEKRGFSKSAPDLEERLRRIEVEMKGSGYRNHFLFRSQNRLVPVGIEEICYFQAENGIARCATKTSDALILDKSLDALVNDLNPLQFFRASRQFIIKKQAVVDIEYYFNGRLQVNLIIETPEPVIISKAKATEFKEWLTMA